VLHSFTSRTSRSITYRERRIWCYSNILLKLMECLELEVRARILAMLSCQVASAWVLSALCSTQTLPMANSKANNPSSHAAMVPSLLSRSLSRARSCSHNLSATDDVATAPGGGEGLHQSTSGDQRHDKKQDRATAYME
jgi:hypothetical protein